jgi:hypothetical protein
MGDRPGSSFRVRTSEDKVRRKDLCWSVRVVYVLEKRPDVSGPSLEEVDVIEWYQSRLSWFYGRVCRSCVGMVCMAGVDPEWSHSMAHALALDTQTWPRENVPGLGLTDEDVGLLRG